MDFSNDSALIMQSSRLRKEIFDLLIKEGVLFGDGLIPHKKPGHGSCCCCQVCGHWTSEVSECVCQNNRLVYELSKIFKQVVEDEQIEQLEPTYIPIDDEHLTSSE